MQLHLLGATLFTGVHICKLANLQICKFANMQFCTFANLQARLTPSLDPARPPEDVLACRFASLQVDGCFAKAPASSTLPPICLYWSSLLQRRHARMPSSQTRGRRSWAGKQHVAKCGCSWHALGNLCLCLWLPLGTFVVHWGCIPGCWCCWTYLFRL